MNGISDFAMFRFNFWHKPFFSHHAAAIAAAQAGQAGMENSSYLPNPLTSPALMVLASTAAENHEGTRLPAPPHPFPGQGIEGKDLPSPYNTQPFTMYRPGDPFPPPLYSHVPPFVRPGIDRSMGLMSAAAGGSAFRPVSTEGEPTYHSAFGPSAKKTKHDDSSSSYSPRGKSEHEFTDVNSEGGESKGCVTPHHIKEERPSSISSTTNSDAYSEGGEFERGTPEEGRSLRKQRKKCLLDGQTPCCPICGLTLRNGEIEAHFAMEMDRLEKIVRGGRKSRDTTPQGRKMLPSPMCGRRGKESPSMESVSQSRYDTYLRIRCNRQARLSVRTRTKKKRPTEETACPICNEKLFGSPEELNAHVELCLKRRSENSSEDEPVDVEGDNEQYEEYEWAGQTRIRVSTMLQGGYSGSGFQTSNSRKTIDDDTDLNVDGDDSVQYGQPQFSEADIIPCSSEEPRENKERDALRGAILQNTETNRGSPHQEVSTSQTSMDVDSTEENGYCSPGIVLPDSGSSSELVEALKAKLREKEECVKGNKCLICMESYKDPLTSIQCWHVHCEECWLKTLGAKKLCPQCNMITAPADLRRIYL